MTVEQVNSKVVRVRLTGGRRVVARRGAMLAYTGRVAFRPVTAHGPGGPGMGGMGGLMGAAGRMMAGEHVSLMGAEGVGDVLYGYRGLYVTVVPLVNDTLSVESERLLLHDADLSTSVESMVSQGGLRGVVRGAATGQGLFTTRISGTGTVVLLAHGGTTVMPVDGGRRVSVDPQAYVAHTGRVQLDVGVSGIGWRDAVGRGSGEAVQLHASGQGLVYVQASEQRF